MSVYGSVTPNLMLTKFLDGTLGIGRSAYELVKGVDCPYSATYIAYIPFLETGVPYHLKNSNSALVFRTITTIGNYDYLWDFIFYQCGSVEAKVHASGYIASSFALKDNYPFGHQVAENVTGNVHTHFINLKVDLDVLGL